MDLSAILQTGLGLAALYWLLATACSFALELINSLRNVRGNALSLFICDMAGAQLRQPGFLTGLYERFTRRQRKAKLLDDAIQSNGWIGHLLIDHPLVRVHEKPNIWRDSGGTLPSYVPGGVFTSALIDVLVGSLRFSPRGYAYLLGKSSLQPALREKLENSLNATAAADTRAGSAARTLRAGMAEIQALVPLEKLVTPGMRKKIRDTVADLVRTPEGELRTAATAGLECDKAAICEHKRALNALWAALPPPGQAIPFDTIIELALRCARGNLPCAPSEAQLAQWLSGACEPPWLHGVLYLPLRAGATRRAIAAAGLTFDEQQTVDQAVRAASKELTFADLQAVLDHGLIPDKLRTALRPLLASTSHDIGEVRKSIETWYDGVMDRATGWYKRQTMVLLGLIALVPIFALNIDSLQIGERLLNNSGLRNAWDQVARRIYSDPGEMKGWVQRNAALLALNQKSILADESKAYTNLTVNEQEAVEREARAVLAASMRQADFAPAFAFLVARDPRTEADLRTLASLIDATCADDAAEPEENEQKQQSCSTARDLLSKFNLEVPNVQATTFMAAAFAMEPAQLAIPEKARELVDSFLTHPGLVANGGTNRELIRFIADAKTARKDRGLSGRADVSLKRVRDELFKTDAVAMSALAGTLDRPWRWREYYQAHRNPEPKNFISHVRNYWAFAKAVALTAVGLALTALMVALGAPFWFDLIGKIANVRGTGDRPSGTAAP